MLRIGPESIDALIFSHGHYDHFGCLVGFLQQNRSKLRTELAKNVSAPANGSSASRRISVT